MPSRLRIQTSIEEDLTESIQTVRRTSSPPSKKQKMSLSQTYFVAAAARTKLGKEACRPDHNLRLLVGHANLLDALMIDLHDAEREQEAWFNQTVQKASVAKAEQPKHIQWMDTVDEKMEEDDDEEESEYDSASETEDSDDEEEELDIPAIPRRRSIRTAPVSVSSREMMEDDEDFEEDDEDDEEHALVRTISGTSASYSPTSSSSPSMSPPELVVDDSESDDDSPPTSPPAPSFEFSEAQRQAIATTTLFNEKSAIYPVTVAAVSAASAVDEMDYVESRWEQSAPMVAAC